MLKGGTQKGCGQQFNIQEDSSDKWGPQGSVLGSELLIIFVSSTASGIKCTLIKFAEDSKLCTAASLHMLEGSAPSRGTWTGLRQVGLWETHEAQDGQVQGAVLGLKQSQAGIQTLGRQSVEEQPQREGLGGVGG